VGYILFNYIGGIMKKTSNVVKENNVYELVEFIKNTAVIKSVSGKTGLFNIETGQIIGEMDYFDTKFDKYDKLYIQIKKVKLEDDKLTDAKPIVKYEERIRIYDVENEKIIVDDFIIEKSYDSNYKLCVLRSPINNKLYVFDNRVVRNMDYSIFDLEIDDVEKFYSSYWENYLIVTVNGKKGIYCPGKGLVTEIIYDDIYFDLNVVIFTKGQQKGFTLLSSINDEIQLIYDDIYTDIMDDEDDFIYCKSGEKIYVYDYKNKRLLFEYFADKLEYVCRRETYNLWKGYIFKFKNNDKYGLISLNMKDSYDNETIIQTSLLLNALYDEINYENGLFYLKDNNKVGIFQDSFYGGVSVSSRYVNISPKYDKIDSLNDEFYAFYVGDKCDITRLSTILNPIVKECEIVEVVNYGLVFKKDNTYGILIPRSRHNLDDDEDILLDGYDHIKHVNSGLFLVEQNGKMGVCCRGSIIIPLIYKDINLHISKSEKHFCMENVCFSLTKDNEYYSFAYKEHWDTFESDVEYEKLKKYRSIEFLPDIIILKDRRNSYIYDYSRNLLKTLSSKVEISVVEKNGYNKKRLYLVDSDYYVYQDNKFEKGLMEENDLYITTYESDYGTVVVNSYDKQKHDKICEQIESDGEEIFNDKIITYYESDESLQEKYPLLIRKKIPPKNNY